MGLFLPATSWEVPTSLPDWRNHKFIALDIENKDDGLKAKHGSSWPMRGGHISGITLACEAGAQYAPVRHPETNNLDIDVVRRWIVDHGRAGCHFITHHGSHDWGWLRKDWEIDCSGFKLDDTEAAAALVDENRLNYQLDQLCRWRGVPGKDEEMLRAAARELGFGNPKEDMWQMPAKYVGPYAEQDGTSTLALFHSLWSEIEQEELVEAYQLEMDLMPCILEMRLRGVRVNMAGAEAGYVKWIKERDKHLAEISRTVGGTVDMKALGSNQWLMRTFKDQGLGDDLLIHQTETWLQMKNDERQAYCDRYAGRTLDGQQDLRAEFGMPSFSAVWMRKHKSKLVQLIDRAGVLDNMANKFIRGYILDHAHNGRIHATINQFRGSEDDVGAQGTRSHRFSYANPPLQQMPSRDEDLAPEIRGYFLPDEGAMWASHDYKQQEYKLIVDFAAILGCTGAEAAVERYVNDPNTDFHDYVAGITGLPRRSAKDCNFAKAFGAGKPKFAVMIGQPLEVAGPIMDQYDEELPFVKELMSRVQNLAQERGYIRLIDLARRHFDRWEPAWRAPNEPYDPKQDFPRPLAEARARWGNRRLKRYAVHKAGNALIQGSAARQTKRAMLAMWRDGFTPLLQMHDELNNNVTTVEECRRIADHMSSAYVSQIPFTVDAEIGENWGIASSAHRSAFDPKSWS